MNTSNRIDAWVIRYYRRTGHFPLGDVAEHKRIVGLLPDLPSDYPTASLYAKACHWILNRELLD